MPTLVTLGALKIVVFFNDTDRHQIAHFHILSPEGRVAISIADGTVLAGTLSLRKIRPALEWAEMHRDVLIAEWNRCNPHRPMGEEDTEND